MLASLAEHLRHVIHVCRVQDEIQAGLQYLFQTNSKYTLLVSGTGHAGDCLLGRSEQITAGP